MIVEDLMCASQAMQECGIEVLRSGYDLISQDRDDVKRAMFVFVEGETGFDLCLLIDNGANNVLSYDGKNFNRFVWPTKGLVLDGLCSDDLQSLIKGNDRVELNKDLFINIKRMLS